MAGEHSLNDKEFIRELAENLGIEYIDLETAEISVAITKMISEKLARTYRAIPLSMEGDVLKVAIADTMDFQALDDLKLATGKIIQPVLATPRAIEATLNHYYRGTEQAEQAVWDFTQSNVSAAPEEQESIAANVDSSPIVRIVNSILVDAVNTGTSDIHIEPFEKEIRVRMRVDGDLNELMQLPPSMLSGIVTRIKVMADLNIAETKRPQDGRVQMMLDGKLINMRISLIPTVYGEKIVIRLLNSKEKVYTMDDIGFSPFNLSLMQRMMKISEGIILLTGPTGSGKTTTLYALLQQLNKITSNIITLEDPVEYKMFGINQVQVNSQIGMTFASGLRSILRQDPDIIMLGEIRDEETAQIAIRSAVTGHVVLSTLHTNDTASSVTRLTDMGVPSYMVTNAVAGIVAQRLLKKICPFCAESYEATEDEKRMLGMEGSVIIKRGRGCQYCGKSGYKGRTSIHEILVLDQDIKALITKGGSAAQIKEMACSKGMTTLEDSARSLVLQGVTTVDQMVRATYNLD